MSDLRVPFRPEELEVIEEYPSFIPQLPGRPAFNSPITQRENIQRFLRGEHPLWMPSFYEFKLFNPRIIPDNIARAMVADGEGPFRADSIYNKDYFGIEWEYVPSANGSMVRPGKPFLEDINDWEEKIVFPDLSKWDWEASAEKNKAYLNDRRAIHMTIFTGFFERLISFLDMENALLAMIDEDEQDAVKAFFDRLADFYEELITYWAKYYKPTFLWFHDDWGSQKAPLFSLATVREMVVPYLRRVVDKAHSLGIGFELHCCGNNAMLVPAMLEAGIDMWGGQPLNDKTAIYREFGKELKLGVEAPSIPPTASDQEAREAAMRFLDTYPENIYVCMSRDYDPRFYQIMYEETRKRYCS